MSQDDSADEMDDDMELMRRKIQERNDYLSSLMNDPEYAEAMNAINSLKENQKTSRRKKRNSSGDTVFRFTGYIPAERRKSARLENKEPVFSYLDLPSETNWNRNGDRTGDKGFDYNDLEEIVYEPKKRRISNRPPRVERHIIPVQDVTPEMLDNIARKVSEKRRSDEKGTTCHQCRQKTIDTKTCCRSDNCIGVRGQFCGPCMMNRYGQDVAVALLDPNWECFVCQGICNCSFCRAKDGKRPTGILTHIAQKNGYRSVQEFLERINKDESDSAKLIGFSRDLKCAVLYNDVQYELYRDYKLRGKKEQFKEEVVKNSTPLEVLENVKKSEKQLKISASIFGLSRKKKEVLKRESKSENIAVDVDLKVRDKDDDSNNNSTQHSADDEDVAIKKTSVKEKLDLSVASILDNKNKVVTKIAQSDEGQLLIGFTKEGKPVLK